MNGLREKIAIALAQRFEFPSLWGELSEPLKEMHRDNADVLMPIVREAVRGAAQAAALRNTEHSEFIDVIVKRVCG